MARRRRPRRAPGTPGRGASSVAQPGESSSDAQRRDAVHQHERAAIAEVAKAHDDPGASKLMRKDEHVGTLLVQWVAVSLERRDEERQGGLPDLGKWRVEHFSFREVPAAGKPGDAARGIHRRARPLGQIGLDGFELGSSSCVLRAVHALLELVGLDASLEVRGA